MLEKVGDPQLRVYAVWVPMLTPQKPRELDRNAARGAKARLDDARVVNFTDPQAISPKEFAPVLGIASYAGKQVPAWDVYLLYGPDAKWPAGAAPPAPAYWQHQLSHGAPAELRLNGDTLRTQVASLPTTAASPSR